MVHGSKITIINISALLEIAVKREIKLTRLVQGNWTYTVRGSAKEYILCPDAGVMIFEGWKLPMHLDNETSSLGPPRQFNFVTDHPGVLREFINKFQINTEFNAWHKLKYQPAGHRSKHWLDLFKKVEA